MQTGTSKSIIWLDHNLEVAAGHIISNCLHIILSGSALNKILISYDLSNIASLFVAMTERKNFLSQKQDQNSIGHYLNEEKSITALELHLNKCNYNLCLESDELFDRGTHNILNKLKSIISDRAKISLVPNDISEQFIDFYREGYSFDDALKVIDQISCPGREVFFKEMTEVQNLDDTLSPDRISSLKLLLSNFTDLEIPTIEICAKFMILGIDLPAQFIEDMRTQIWDEARHAQMFFNRFVQLGGRAKEFEGSNGLWEACKSQRLSTQFAVHQCYGEWIGIDGAFYFEDKFRKAGDKLTADLFGYVAVDEISHVQTGMRWLNYLCKNEFEVQKARLRAAARREKVGKEMNGPLIFPLNERICEICDLDEPTITRLKERFQDHGCKVESTIS